jgi:hypothetical protein
MDNASIKKLEADLWESADLLSWIKAYIKSVLYARTGVAVP